MDVVIGIAMTSQDTRLLLVEGNRGDGAVIDHDSLDADTPVDVAHPGFNEPVVNAVLDTYADAPANGYTVTRTALTWTDAVNADAKLMLDALAEQGITNVAVVSAADAERLGGQADSAMDGSDASGDGAAARLARGALLASAGIRDEPVSSVKPAPMTHTIAMAVATAVLIVVGSVFLAMTVRGGHGSSPQQASTPTQHTAPAPPADAPVHTVVRNVVPMAGRAAQQSLAGSGANTSMPPPTGVVRR